MKNSNCYTVIMAGGVGSRFWPASRNQTPKQFLDMLGIGKSLLRMTFERMLPITPVERIIVMTHESYKEQVLAHLPELFEDQVICEPSRNNTAPCVAYAALHLKAKDPDATMIIVSSDHIILKEQEFIERLRIASNFVEDHDALVSISIRPTRPDTGYGYLKYDEKSTSESVFKVEEFKEKPNFETAQSYLDSGKYVWNAGIFVWKVQHILDAIQKYEPEICNILNAGYDIYNTREEVDFIKKNYPLTPNISIDFAVMERADNVFTVFGEFGWSDLGTWASLHQELPKDEHENVIQGENILVASTTNCIIKAEDDKLLIVNGLDDFIIVSNEKVLLIYPKKDEQNIKKVTQLIAEKGLSSYL
ncbi:MAG: mannose-1-phosphate guanylyltransferase [Saprospiraceae bacterium]|nr:mannose-1-phosphate guanylyltransferase [Saprospiraceae bacterium]